jgi:hypothetical protein
VHVLLRQLPRGEDDPMDKVKVELAVFDTGKVDRGNFPFVPYIVLIMWFFRVSARISCRYAWRIAMKSLVSPS